MVKLLIINQHASNRGDESALRGFLSKFDSSSYEITLLYNTLSLKGAFDLGSKIKKFVLPEPINRLEKAIVVLSFFLPLFILRKILPSKIKKEIALISEADLVINAPGGANMGLYKDWLYLWRLYIAKKINKKTAIYSISFGPFPPKSLYTYLAKRTLREIDFISLRDTKSFDYADVIGLHYIKSIDTAFLCSPGEDLSNFSLSNVGVPFQAKDFIVFVPNELNKWHPYFRKVPKENLEEFYCLILDCLLESGTNVVFLPQLFGTGNDIKYFETLKQRVNEKYHPHMHIVDDHQSSDNQQKIVSLSKGVVGARYHSIVFSINNGLPFLCLSYEHKMENMLQILNLQEYSISLKKIFDKDEFEEHMGGIYSLIKTITNTNTSPIDNRVPKKIALECFTEFENKFLQIDIL